MNLIKFSLNFLLKRVGSIDVKEKQDNKENFIKEDSVISQKSSVSASQLEFLSNSRNSMNENKDLKTDELGLTNSNFEQKNYD